MAARHQFGGMSRHLNSMAVMIIEIGRPVWRIGRRRRYEGLGISADDRAKALKWRGERRHGPGENASALRACMRRHRYGIKYVNIRRNNHMYVERGAAHFWAYTLRRARESK